LLESHHWMNTSSDHNDCQYQQSYPK
jgi:hypothetical protein